MQPINPNQYEMNKTVFPRTGARGLPQQFPRRLFDMLESESQGPGEKLIQWTASGLAFDIIDVTLFSAYVLPKYYKTNRFSSFQRNLNLYGFKKPKVGPDTDCYYHPAFQRGRADLLCMIQKLKTTYAAKKKQQKQKKIIEEFDAQNAAAIISTMSTIHKANEKLKQSAAPPSTSHNAGFIGEEKQSFENDDRQTRTYAEIVAVNNTNVAAAPVPPPAPTAVMETKQNVEEEKKEPEKVVQVQKPRTQTPVITLQVPLNASASPASIGRKVEEDIRATPSSGASVPPPPAVPNVPKHGYDEYPHPPKEHSSHHGHEQGHHYYHKEHMQYPPPPNSHAYKHYPPPPYMHGYQHGPPPPHYHHPHAVSVPVPVPVYSSHGPSPPEYYSTYPAPLHPYYAHAPSVYPHQSAPHERNPVHRRLHRHPRYPYNEKLGYDEQGGYGSKDLFRRIGIYQNKEKTETSTSDASSETHANDMNSTDDAPSEKVSSKEELPKFKPPSSHCNMSTHVREEQAKRKALKDKFEDNVSKNTMDVNNKKSIPKSNSLDYLSDDM